MEELLIDCSPGVSGDMLLGAFYDLGVPENVIEKPLIDLGLKNLYSLKFEESKSCSIRGVKVQVNNKEPNIKKRDWRGIRKLFLNGNLENKLLKIILKYLNPWQLQRVMFTGLILKTFIFMKLEQ